MNFGKIDRLVIFGGGQLLVEFVLKLINNSFQFLVVTSERHSKEMVRISSGNLTLKQFLVDRKINYHISKDINSDDYVINWVTPNTLGISMGAAWIFKAKFINRFHGRLLNLHGTRLPQNRGGGGFSWQILRNNRLGFGLIHQIDPGVDTGAIVRYKEFFYSPSCRVPKQYKEISIKNTIDILSEFLEDVKKTSEFQCSTQQEYFSTYWPRLSTEIHGFIDWNWSLRDIELFACAFDEPYKGASTFINNKRVYFKNCFSDFNDGCFHPFQKGIVYRKKDDALFVATEDGSLIVKDVKSENGEDLINKINIGDRFYTPVKFLEEAKKYRAIYTPKGLKNIFR